MIAFWLLAVALLAGALALLLPALLRPRQRASGSAAANVAVHRDQLREAERDLAAGLIAPERFEQARAEIQRRVLEDTAAAEAATTARPARGTALALAVLIPLGSLLVYLQVGEPRAIAPAARGADGHAVEPAQVETLVAALAERLKSEPGNAQGWLMLGRSYAALERYADAAEALRRAAALLPPDAGLLADLADVTGMAQGRRLAGEPARLVQQALALDPRHVKALALAGSAAFEARDYAGARAHWERLAAQLPADSEMTRSVQANIAEARQLEGGSAPAPAAPATAQAAQGAQAAQAPAARPAPAGPTVAAAGARLSGRVQLSPALAGQVAPGDTLFVFARAAQGPRMPLAIVRAGADRLPFEFALDDSMAMSPELRLSGFPELVVVARISKSGQATPQPGDLGGQSAPVKPGAQGVQVLIDQVQR